MTTVLATSCTLHFYSENNKVILVNNFPWNWLSIGSFVGVLLGIPLSINTRYYKYTCKSGTVSTADTVYWETKEVVTIHNVACLKWPRTRNGPERVRQPCFPKTHMEILASCINQLEGETRKFWWESVVVVHGKFCYKGFLRPSAATHGGKSLSERMWTDALLCPMPKSTYW